jgi:hypothetical protein
METTILDKTKFKGCFLWSRQNGEVIEIDRIIAVHINVSLLQEDTETLMNMFGQDKFLKVIDLLKDEIPESIIIEATAQYNYILDKDAYICERSVEEVLKAPIQRDIDFLLRTKTKEDLLSLVQEMELKFPRDIFVKQMIS